MGKIFAPIDNAEDWRQFLAEPDKQWRSGFSAKAMAYCWQSADGIPPDVLSVLEQEPAFGGLETLLVIPEHKVPLPGGRRASQNDAWVLAAASEGLVSIAVEGKVSEPFGPTVGEWMVDASPGKKERLEFLCGLLGMDNPPPDDVRYQLLHRTASAVIEARRFHAQHAAMIVHSFSQTLEWFEDYARFAALMGTTAEVNLLSTISRETGPTLNLGWVKGDARFLDA